MHVFNLLKDICHVNTNFDDDVFVGVKIENSEVSVSFPLGYDLSNEEKDIRKDILKLISVLRKSSKRQGNSELFESGNEKKSFPIHAYQKTVLDYLNNGYFCEIEVLYKPDKKGKIDWNRTIKMNKPTFQDEKAYYLDFIVKKNTINSDNIITLIHEYCVYESFNKIGWLYTSYKPNKPRIKFNKPLYVGALKQKMEETFNDTTIEMLQNMLQVVNDIENSYEDGSKSIFGTYNFEYVWEEMIDHIFGIEHKERFFPNTKWNLRGYPKAILNRCLEPDTIMMNSENVYIIDSKYYKYGITGNPIHLPATSSIHKQITYGEYIEQKGYSNIYNAFIMPCNIKQCVFNSPVEYNYIGYAESEWKGDIKSYERVYGFLADVKWIMKQYTLREEAEQEKLSRLIDKAINDPKI